jgi:hypothetical protein
MSLNSAFITTIFTTNVFSIRSANNATYQYSFFNPFLTTYPTSDQSALSATNTAAIIFSKSTTYRTAN